MSDRWGVFFENLEYVFRMVCALIWSVHDELVHVHNCTTSFVHSSWFGKQNVFAATLERAKSRQLFAAQKQSV